MTGGREARPRKVKPQEGMTRSVQLTHLERKQTARISKNIKKREEKPSAIVPGKGPKENFASITVWGQLTCDS